MNPDEHGVELQLAWVAEKFHDWTDLPVERDLAELAGGLQTFFGTLE